LGHNGDRDRMRAFSTPVGECSEFFGALTLLTCGVNDACKAGMPVPLLSASNAQESGAAKWDVAPQMRRRATGN